MIKLPTIELELVAGDDLRFADTAYIEVVGDENVARALNTGQSVEEGTILFLVTKAVTKGEKFKHSFEATYA